MILFSVGDKTFESLQITKFVIHTDIMDGEGTGRTQGSGLPLFRDPAGTFKQIELEISSPMTNNQEFTDLLNILDNFGAEDFKTVSFVAPFGMITQEMYSSSYTLGALRIQSDGTMLFEPLRIKFIAKKAFKV